MIEPLCFNCIFFVPEGMTHNELDLDQWDNCISGDCRRHCPVAGEPSDDDHHVNYAYWPIVIAGDWCGEHRPRDKQNEGHIDGDEYVIGTTPCK